MILKLGMQHQVLEAYKVYINKDYWLTLTLYGKVKLGCLCICMGKMVTKFFLSEQLAESEPR